MSTSPPSYSEESRPHSSALRKWERFSGVGSNPPGTPRDAHLKIQLAQASGASCLPGTLAKVGVGHPAIAYPHQPRSGRRCHPCLRLGLQGDSHRKRRPRPPVPPPVSRSRHPSTRGVYGPAPRQLRRDVSQCPPPLLYAIIPAATVSFVPSSIKIKLPVFRFRLYLSNTSGVVV